MKFGPVPLAQAEGKILGHNVSNQAGKRVLNKGGCLTTADIRLLEQTGRSVIYVAELETDDIDEDTAAERIARSVCGEGVRLTNPKVGRVNLVAQEWSVLRVDASRLARMGARCRW